jgi:hypothetical protein
MNGNARITPLNRTDSSSISLAVARPRCCGTSSCGRLGIRQGYQGLTLPHERSVRARRSMRRWNLPSVRLRESIGEIDRYKANAYFIDGKKVSIEGIINP